ncbi:MAG: DUF6036 family nucleotidyltransferase [Kiritimatiellae bacterium]|nr:DUF6036 family nucleotidyltransferase [Kiritimatiellia bacterium]
MTQQEIELYFNRLSEILSTYDVVGEIVLFGGAAMVLAHKARASTKDVDAIFEPKDMVYRAAAAVSQECGAAEGWLNDAVKGFVSEKGATAPLLDLPNLKVYVAVPEYLLAMKCMSMRLGKDETDIRDIRFLMQSLGLRSADEVLRIVERFYPQNRIQPKTRFAVEELCQNLEAK